MAAFEGVTDLKCRSYTEFHRRCFQRPRANESQFLELQLAFNRRKVTSAPIYNNKYSYRRGIQSPLVEVRRITSLQSGRETVKTHQVQGRPAGYDQNPSNAACAEARQNSPR